MPPRPPESFHVRLASARALAPSVREMVFERVDGAPLDFLPGQWLNLMLPIGAPGEEEQKRAYSIASAPNGTPRFELAVTRVAEGPGSNYLHRMQVGDTLRAVGPSGLFTREANDPAPALFVGTGTGITPLRSMLHAALDDGSEVPLHLLFGVRHEEDILYREELERLSQTHPNVVVHITLSRPEAGWTGLRGWVQGHVPKLLASLDSPHIYVCGLDRMVAAVRALLRNELGVDRKRVHTERYD